MEHDPHARPTALSDFSDAGTLPKPEANLLDAPDADLAPGASDGAAHDDGIGSRVGLRWLSSATGGVAMFAGILVARGGWRGAVL